MRAEDITLWTDYKGSKWVRYEYYERELEQPGFQIEIKDGKRGYIQRINKEGLHFLDVIEGDDLIKIREKGEEIIRELQEELIENNIDFGLYE